VVSSHARPMPIPRPALLSLTLLLAALGCSKPTGGDEPSPQGSAAPARTWEPLSSPEGRFSALLLSGAKQEKSHVKWAEVTVENISYLVATPEGRAYSIAYVDYPVALVKAKSPDDMLDGARGGIVAKVGQLVSEKKITVDGAAGRELLLAGKDAPVTARVRIAMVDNRLYTLQAMTFGPLHDVPDPDADRFFDSFRLVKK
jgi:hypothetical protein